MPLGYEKRCWRKNISGIGASKKGIALSHSRRVPNFSEWESLPVKADRFQDLSLSDWISHVPAELVMAHLNLDQNTFDKIPKEKVPVVPG